MSYDSRIALMGQQPDVMGSIGQGLQAGQLRNEIGTQNALRTLYQNQGAQIAQGDPNALNALAGISPQASLGVEGSRLGMDATREQMAQRRAAASQAVQTHARGMSAAQRAEEREQIARGLSTAIPALRSGDLNAVNQVLRTAGLEPAGTLEDAGFVIAQYEGALEGFDAMQGVMGEQVQEADYATIDGQLVDRAAQGGPSVVPIQGMPEPQAQFRPASTEESAQYGAQAGQFNTETGRFHPHNPPSGMTLETTPEGIRLVQGPGAGENPNSMPQPQPMLSGTATALEDIGRIGEIVRSNPLVTGFAGNLMSGLPGTDAYDAAQLLQTVRANMTFENLNQLRQNSATGSSGLGQVTNVEIGLLGSALGNLDQGQSEGQFTQNMARLERQLNAIVYGDPDGEEAAEQRLQQGLPLYGQTVNGMVYVGGDPNNQRSWRRTQ